MAIKNYLEQINECIKHNKLSIVAGGAMAEFESEAAILFGHTYGVSTCNGTSSIYLSLFCLSQLSPKKEIILPAYGFHGILSAVCAYGLKPIFCDVDPLTYTINFDLCEKLINKNTLAVMVLHPWGNLANLKKIQEIKKRHQIYFISDSSHAHEATWQNQPIGKYFDINCASFGLGKLISGGELGILSTDNPQIRDLALLFSHTNRVPYDLITDNYKHMYNAVGIKFRPHVLALLLALYDLKNNREQRKLTRNLIQNFQDEISSYSKKIIFQQSYPECQRVFWMPTLDLNKEIDVDTLIKDLTNNGISVIKHKFDTIMSQMNIFTDFYHSHDSNIYPNSSCLTQKHIIHLLDKDFTDPQKILKLKQIIKIHLS